MQDNDRGTSWQSEVLVFPTLKGKLVCMERLERAADPESDVVIPRKRYADCIIHDTCTALNVAIIEVKLDEHAAVELQNNEQMLGLWKEHQCAILGLEARGHTVQPKILLGYNDALAMHYLTELNVEKATDMAGLVKLVMAFLIFVEY